MPVSGARAPSRWTRLLTGLVACCALAGTAPARAQFADRAGLPWRTLETAHFRFIFPDSLSAWALPVAARFESVRAAVDAAVGSAPARRVTVVMDDPVTVSNGLTVPELRAPTILFLATPPGPRTEIGDNPGWGEILSVHEYTHAAHLSRPSRNPLLRWIEDLPLLPTDIGPIMRRAPRWVTEGYATYLEGRLTGSGRPHGVWRAAVLREWALEGKLPSYGGMSDVDGYRGGSFAYLAGSAYLEWLVAQRGDSSLPHLWRRLSARQRRNFPEAFAGVFGGMPSDLYDRFRVQITERALEARRALAASGLAEGETVQALEWQTGDPAVSRDGSHIAIVLRARDLPSRVVVWKAAAEPDTATQRRIARMLARDREDVAPVTWRPPPRRALATLWPAAGGRAYDDPRFLPDGDHILLTRFEQLPDGSRRPDLVIWDWRHGGVRRVTHGAAIVEADPTPDGRSAIGVRCRWAACDLVRVDLASGALTMLAPGSTRAPEVVWSRPRVSRDGSMIAAARQVAGRWGVVLVSTQTGAVTPIGEGDGAQRYDPAFLPGDSALVVTSEAGGIPNLEVIHLGSGGSRSLTRVTGAAMAPEPEPDGGILFLRLHGHGLDLARVRSDARIGPVVALDSALSPAAPLPLEPGTPFPAGPVPHPRGYGLGLRQYRLIPSVGLGDPGVAARLALASSDPVGRLGWLLQGGVGHTPWSGASLRLVYRALTPRAEAGAFATVFHPGLIDARADSTGLPRRIRYDGVNTVLDLRHLGSASATSLRLGGALGRLDAAGARSNRRLAWLDLAQSLETASPSNVSALRLGAHASAGTTAGADWSRGVASATLSFTGRRPGTTLAVQGMGGVVRGGGILERFALGGEEPPFFDAALSSQQIAMPALPHASLVGSRFSTFDLRLGGNNGGWLYAWAGRVTPTPGWQRVLGAEQELEMDAVPLLRVPGLRARLGVGYTLDEKPHRAVRAYGTATLTP